MSGYLAAYAAGALTGVVGTLIFAYFFFWYEFSKK